MLIIHIIFESHAVNFLIKYGNKCHWKPQWKKTPKILLWIIFQD